MWHEVQDVYLLSRAHGGWIVGTPKSKEAHTKTKPNRVVDYNTHKTGSINLTKCYLIILLNKN
jgi:hypothetical protein